MSDSEKLPKKIGSRKKPGAKTPPIANSAEEPKKKNRKSISSKDLYPAARLSLAITNAGFFRFYGRKPRNKPSLPDNGVLLPRGYKSNLFLVGDTKLHSSDEEVLIALLAIAADKHRSGTYNIKAKERNALDENLRRGEVISISFIRSELAKILGWRINKAAYVSILHSLIRLNMATFEELPEKPVATEENPNPKPHPRSSIPYSRLIAFTKDIAIIKEGQGLQEIEWARQRTVEVILCEHLSRFVLDPNMKVAYGLHLMDERRLLNRLGKTLYTHIVAHVWPGKKGKIHLDNVLRKITGRKPSAADRISAIKALQPISVSPPHQGIVANQN